MGTFLFFVMMASVMIQEKTATNMSQNQLYVKENRKKPVQFNSSNDIKRIINVRKSGSAILFISCVYGERKKESFKVVDIPILFSDDAVINNFPKKKITVW